MMTARHPLLDAATRMRIVDAPEPFSSVRFSMSPLTPTRAVMRRTRTAAPATETQGARRHNRFAVALYVFVGLYRDLHAWL